MVQPDGSFKLAGQLMLEDLARDKYAIAYVAGGEAWVTPAVKTIALSEKTGGKAHEPTIHKGRGTAYPMYAHVFFLIKRDPQGAVDPEMREVLRLVLSRGGQGLGVKEGQDPPP